MFQRRRPADFLIVIVVALLGFYVVYTLIERHEEEKKAKVAQLLTSTPYVLYAKGEVDLVIFIPNDGAREPEGWPKRRHGCTHEDFEAHGCFFNSTTECLRDAFNCEVETMPDSFTREIGVMVHDTIEKSFGKPHILIFNIKRKFLDVSDDEEESAQGFQEAHEVYQRFTEMVKALKQDFQMKNKRGLFLTLQGQSHYKNLTEIGLTIFGKDIVDARNDSPILNSDRVRRKSSVFRLLSENPEITLHDLWGGHEYSLASLMNKDGFQTLPMPKFPYVDKHHGGVRRILFGDNRIHQMMGSSNDGLSPLDSIEINISGTVRHSKDLRKAFAESLGKAIVSFYSNFY